MKRFTQKFFLLTIGMILSVGAYADDITHRYPAIPYTIPGNPTRTYEMPAWDIKLTDWNDIRVQTIAPLPTTTDGHFKGKIVARRTFSNEANNYGSPLFASSPNTSTLTIGGKTFAEAKAEFDPDNSELTTWTYGLACAVLGKEIADEAKSMKIFTLSAYSGTTNDEGTTDFTIPSTYKVSNTSASETYKGRTFDIVEIGVGAFRNYTMQTTNVLKVTGTITIPNTITKIEHNAFRHGVFKKVVFEEGSTLQTIENATFEGCGYLEEVNIPASVQTIKGTAFGSCESLHKVIFEGEDNLPTFTLEDEEPLYPSEAKYPGPYSVFEGATRFQGDLSSGSFTTGQDVHPEKCIVEVPLGKAKSYLGAANVNFSQFPMSSKFEMNKQYTTYCSDLDFTFKQYDTSSQSWSDGDVKVYYVEESDVELQNSKVNLTEITGDFLVPGWKEGEGNDFGVVLKGVSGETYNIFYPNGHGITTLYEVEGDNCLHGCTVSTPINVVGDENHTYFVLNNGVFRRVETNGSCKANKAYIMISGKDISGPGMDNGTESKDLILSFPDESTGITTYEVKSVQNDVWYTLQGIQVKQPQKGIVIKNGKKYVIK